MLGWERFEHDYFPVINLTHPSAENEIRFRLYGPLCMPQDMWGYYIYAHTVEEGDLILVPYQGALTFSLAQSFIKPIPPVVVMPAK
jgi:diaminopimelate decarboxylase